MGGALESFRELWGRVSSAADLDEDFAIDACEVEASIVRTVSGDSGAVDAFADAMDDLVLFWTSLRPERLVATAQTRQVAVRVNETGKAFGGEDVSGRTEDLEAVGVYEGEFSRHREIERRVEERVALMTPSFHVAHSRAPYFLSPACCAPFRRFILFRPRVLLSVDLPGV